MKGKPVSVPLSEKKRGGGTPRSGVPSGFHPLRVSEHTGSRLPNFFRVIPEGWSRKFFEAERITQTRPAQSILVPMVFDPVPVGSPVEELLAAPQIETERVELELYHRPALHVGQCVIPEMAVVLGYSERTKEFFYWHPPRR